jgi:hypothetical protein
VVESSQHSPILESVVQKAAVKDPIAKKIEKRDLDPCHSPKLSPVKLDENFAAANEVGVDNHPNPASPSLSHSLVVESSQHSPILEPADLKVAVKDSIAEQVEKGDLRPCHSLKLSPVNLDENFVAANEVGVSNRPNPESPSYDSEMCVMFDKSVCYPAVPNCSLEKYSLAGCTCNFSQQIFRQEHFYPHVFESRASLCDMFLPTIFNTHLHWQQELHKQVFQHQCLARWQLYCRVCNFAVSLCTFFWHSICWK